MYIKCTDFTEKHGIFLVKWKAGGKFKNPYGLLKMTRVKLKNPYGFLNLPPTCHFTRKNVVFFKSGWQIKKPTWTFKFSYGRGNMGV